MTGKDFFGKLLNNRRDEPLPLDRDDSGTGVPDADLEVAPPSYDVHEEAAGQFEDAPADSQARASEAPPEREHADVAPQEMPRVSLDVEEDIASIPIGGDGQSSPLPEVRPSFYHDDHAEERVNMQRELRSVLLESDGDRPPSGEQSSTNEKHPGRDDNPPVDQTRETILPEPIRLRATGGGRDETPSDPNPEQQDEMRAKPEEGIQGHAPEPREAQQPELERVELNAEPQEVFTPAEQHHPVQETTPAEPQAPTVQEAETPVFIPSSEQNASATDALPQRVPDPPIVEAPLRSDADALAPDAKLKDQQDDQDRGDHQNQQGQPAGNLPVDAEYDESFSDATHSEVQDPPFVDVPAPREEAPPIVVAPTPPELDASIMDVPSPRDQMPPIEDVTAAREQEPPVVEMTAAERQEPPNIETTSAERHAPSITETPSARRPEPTITETPAARRQEPTITETPQARSHEPTHTEDSLPLDEGLTDAVNEFEAAQLPPAAEEDDTPAPPAKKAAPGTGKGDTELRGLKDRVVLRLLEKHIVTPEHVKAALRDRSQENLKATLWRIVAQQRGADREKVYREAALTYAFVERKLDEDEVDLDFIRQVAEVFPEKRRNRLIELRVVPVGYEFEQQTQLLRVVFLTHDPSLPAVRELMQELNLERYELQYASETTVKELLAKAFPRKNEYLERMSEDPLAYDLGMSYEEEKGELIDEEALEAEINRSSLINLFEAALVESVHKGASDIHIYPNAKRQIEIHFRVDGRLLLWHVEDKVHPESLLAVIKDNTTNVDRFEREMAQDGFIQRKVDDTIIRYRVSILPIATAHQSMHSESIVIRVLDDRKVITDLSQLGLLKGAVERFDMAIKQPHGMVILTGPTGSGKSTTLVAALHQVVDPGVNVLSVEDPVEYIIPGVRQIKLNHKLDLEQALRSILRHDPDVVMVGEMRDRHTAELAIKLANTGHLTFSTLHTNDAPSAVSRLYKMGVEPFLIAYAINLVVAQRLIRKLCPDCKVVDNDPDFVLLDRMGFTQQDLAETKFYKPSGDPTCKTCKGVGFKGRRAISEALYFSRAIRHLIVEAHMKIDEDGLRVAAQKEGMLTLQDSAREVVKMGETSTDEMMRVTMVDE